MVLLVAPYVYATKIETHSHVRTHAHTSPWRGRHGDTEREERREWSLFTHQNLFFEFVAISRPAGK